MCGKIIKAAKAISSMGRAGKAGRIPGAGSKVRPMKTTSVGGSKKLR